MNETELARKLELLEIHKRRKHELDRQIAMYGIDVRPHITIEQENISASIEELEREIAKLRQPPQLNIPFVDPFNKELIVDVAKIIDYSAQHIESFLGQPIDIFWRKIGSGEDIPDGGETREYTFGHKYTVWINYTKTMVATGIWLFEGLEEENYPLDDWPIIFERVGLISVMSPPDEKGLITWTWLD